MHRCMQGACSVSQTSTCLSTFQGATFAHIRGTMVHSTEHAKSNLVPSAPVMCRCGGMWRG